MKKSFVVLGLILFSVSFAFANSEELDCYESQIKGKTDAEIMFNPAGAFLTSTVLSYLLSGISFFSILTPARGDTNLHYLPPKRRSSLQYEGYPSRNAGDVVVNPAK